MNRFAPGGPVGEKRVGKGQGGEREEVKGMCEIGTEIVRGLYMQQRKVGYLPVVVGSYFDLGFLLLPASSHSLHYCDFPYCCPPCYYSPPCYSKDVDGTFAVVVVAVVVAGGIGGVAVCWT